MKVKQKLYEITSIPRMYRNDTSKAGEHLAYIKAKTRDEAVKKYGKTLPRGFVSKDIRVFLTTKRTENALKRPFQGNPFEGVLTRMTRRT